jgi:putative oxidoreductase
VDSAASPKNRSPLARQTNAFDRFGHDWAPIVLRLFFGFVLIYGTQDNVFSSARMLEFRDFLQKNGFPYPLECAYLSAYAQFITGALLLMGLLTRLASVVVIINFIVALLMVHRHLPFSANIAPLAMLVTAVFFFLYGAPRYSVDALVANRRSPRSEPAS